MAISGTCTIEGRGEEQVFVTDLGTHGCRMRTGAVGLTRAHQLTLHLPGCPPISASLRWSKGGALGVRFASPLSDTELETLRDHAPASNAVPIRS